MHDTLVPPFGVRAHFIASYNFSLGSVYKLFMIVLQ